MPFALSMLSPMAQRTDLQRLLRGLDAPGRRKVSAAYAFARGHLSVLTRRTGRSYAEHGMEVALVLREVTGDPILLLAALLHDAYLLPDAEALLAASSLTPEERKLAYAMHELRRMHIDANTRDLDKVIAAFSADERLLVLRMAHRINDVRHLGRFLPDLRRAIARETLHMYASIAGRLGMHRWRHEMEDACFRYLQPRTAAALERRLRDCRELDEACLTHTTRFLRRRLRARGIPSRITSRIKGLYSTYRKMVLRKRRFEELTDRLALRVIVPDDDACYRALGVIHAVLHPMPGKLKDYIGAPKENGYRSIHTVVYPLAGVTEQPMEIQIRSEGMHAECEDGLARHTDYKHYLYALHSDETRVHLLRNLESLRMEARSPSAFETALRRYFDDAHAALFDARNNLYHLRKPLTALDFVCHVYGRRFLTLRRVRVNGRERPVGTVLKDGDIIDARFGRRRSADASWAAHCRHAGTRKLLNGVPPV
ncbi:MAG: HD domain-containing protein [Candidatus Peribacteraceae bacterium]|nr:HD domain-containing protein [Candidatus Peribacteraceae bacterium]